MTAHDRPLKLYCAGPMRGIRWFNFDAFAIARKTLRELGHEVFCPAERDLATGFNPVLRNMTGNEDLAECGFDLREALGIDLAWITANADAVIVLPGWATSSGARAEVATANALGLPVHRLHEFVAQGQRAPQLVLGESNGGNRSDFDRSGRQHADDDELDVGQPAAPVVGPAPKATVGTVLGVVGPPTKAQPQPDWREHARKVMAEDPERPLIERTDLAQSEFDGRMELLRRRARIEKLRAALDRHERREAAKAAHPSNPVGEAMVQSFTAAPRVPDGEERITSDTGGAKGRKLAEMGAIDPLARMELAAVAGFGSRKYDRGNYLKGIAWSLSVDAMHRHIAAFEAGEDRDDESGQLHMAHAAWHALALCSFALRGIGTDDRFPADGPVVEGEAA